jgi:hypothetical protein
MDAAIVVDQPPATETPALREPVPSVAARVRARLRSSGGHEAALALLLTVCLLLRLWGIKQGLPYSYNGDEDTHFVPHAIGFFGHDLNPHYFINPPAYSYLLYITFELWFGSGDAVRSAYAADPTAVFVLARVLSAVLGTAAVWLTWAAGARLFNRTVGLLAGGILGLGFLPVFYSHLALNDVPTLAPVALSLYGVAGVIRWGRTRDYATAGIGIGLAAATKYTGGIMLLCLLAAFVSDASGESLRKSARRLALGAALALVAFIIANPYALLDTSSFLSGVSHQASTAAGQDPVKLGTRPGSGITYYLWTFTWGMGWGPTLAAICGAVMLLARRRLGTALVLLPAPIAFIVFMGDQERFFGRWLLPVFPIVALLGAYAAFELGRWLVRSRGLPVAPAGAIVGVLLLGQSFAADVRNDAVLSRADTLNTARAWMVRHIPAGSKVVLEPFVPDNWASDIGRSLAATPTGERWWRWPTWLTNLDRNGQPLPQGEHRFVVVDQYERNLYPGLIDRYIGSGYCWVMIGSLQAGRAFAQPRDAPSATAYYAALAQRARLVYHITPFSSGAHPVPFSFDWSIDYYPPEYRLPGPELSVYRLTEGRCATASS